MNATPTATERETEIRLGLRFPGRDEVVGVGSELVSGSEKCNAACRAEPRCRSAPYPLQPMSYTLSPTPYAFHPIPYPLRLTTYPLHPIPYTRCPVSPMTSAFNPRAYTLLLYTPNPAPCALRPKPNPQPRSRSWSYWADGGMCVGCSERRWEPMAYVMAATGLIVSRFLKHSPLHHQSRTAGEGSSEEALRRV